jgi:hypothetical protein
MKQTNHDLFFFLNGLWIMDLDKRRVSFWVLPVTKKFQWAGFNIKKKKKNEINFFFQGLLAYGKAARRMLGII